MSTPFYKKARRHVSATCAVMKRVIAAVGPWSADMFLMFAISRPDVWPISDYGIRAALKKQFRLKDLPEAKKATALGESWKPYRTVAAWYLWRSLELKSTTEA